MKPYQARVVNEHKELVEKVRALRAFLDGDFPDMVYRDECLLRVQLSAMETYVGILVMRISNFT